MEDFSISRLLIECSNAFDEGKTHSQVRCILMNAKDKYIIEDHDVEAIDNLLSKNEKSMRRVITSMKSQIDKILEV